MNAHEYIRKTEVLKLIQDYMKNVPHSHLECLKTLENRLYKVSPVRISEIVEHLERENLGLHAKNDNLERKMQYKLDHYTDDNKVADK